MIAFKKIKTFKRNQSLIQARFARANNILCNQFALKSLRVSMPLAIRDILFYIPFEKFPRV